MEFQISTFLFIKCEIMQDNLHLSINNKQQEWSNVFTNGFIQKMSAKCGEWMDIDEFYSMIEFSQINRETAYIIKAQDKCRLLQGESLEKLATNELREEDKIFLVFLHKNRKVYYPLPLNRKGSVRQSNAPHHGVRIEKMEIPDNIKDLQAEITSTLNSLVNHISNGNMNEAKMDSKRLQLLNLPVLDLHSKELLLKTSKIKKLKLELQKKNNKIEEYIATIANIKRKPTPTRRSASASSRSSISNPRDNRAYNLRQKYISRRDSTHVPDKYPFRHLRRLSQHSHTSVNTNDQIGPWWERLSRPRLHSRNSSILSNSNRKPTLSLDLSENKSSSPLSHKIKKLQSYLRHMKSI